MSNNEQPLFKEYVGKSLEGCLESLAGKRPVFHSEADFQFALAQEIESVWRENGGKTGKAKLSIRLEYPFRDNFYGERDKYVDIVIILDDGNDCIMIPIELKYKTAKLSCTASAGSKNEEKFNLRNHSARDLAMYDCLKDIERIEKLVKNDNVDVREGYTIWLTNDMYYQNGPKEENGESNFDHFRVYQEGNEPRKVGGGELVWIHWPDIRPKKTESEEAFQQRKAEIEKKRVKHEEDHGYVVNQGRGRITLDGIYAIDWKPYRPDGEEPKYDQDGHIYANDSSSDLANHDNGTFIYALTCITPIP